jgi:carboxypeptidase C (cathepsin A)
MTEAFNFKLINAKDTMCFKIFFFILYFGCSIFCSLEGVEVSSPELINPPKAVEVSITDHAIKINGQMIEYTAIAGIMALKDEKNNNPKASIFFVAYLKKNSPAEKPRPLTFCFNGGPGAASVWLHMGALGPKRVSLDQDKFTPPPYSYIDNEYSLLDISDLVFIDPVSTGYSRAAPGEDVKQFHGIYPPIHHSL